MRKICLVITILVVLILSVGLISCAPANQNEEDVETAKVYYEDQPYSFPYKQGYADCILNLDGAGKFSINKTYYSSHALDKAEPISVLFNTTYYYFIINYNDGELNTKNDTFCFSKEGKLDFASKVDYSDRLSFVQALMEDKTFELETLYYVQGMFATLKISVLPLKYNSGSATIAFGYTISASKTGIEVGDYTIVNGRYIHLKTSYESDYPTAGLYTYQVLEPGEYYHTRLIEESSGRTNGHVEIRPTTGDYKYVQLKDDGTFYFVPSYTTSNPEDLFTKDSYNGLTFTTKMEVISNGEVYEYIYELKFDNNGYADYSGKLCTKTKDYRIEDDETLTVIYYDIQEYINLIGTHMDLGTSNNISFANNYIVYVDYNFSRYTFEGDSNILIHRFNEGYVYVKLKNDDGVIISAKFYDDGTFEWLPREFEGVDFSDHSEDL